MKKMTGIVFMVLVLMGVCQAVEAAPVQISLIEPVQLVKKYDSVSGLRLDLIYGVNENVSGLDIGLVNKTEDIQKGLQIGLYNSSYDVYGVQIGLINRAEWLSGLQIGLVNLHENGDRKFFPIVNFAF